MSADDPATIDAVAAVIAEWTGQAAAKSGREWGPWPAAQALAEAGWLRTADEILTEADRAEAAHTLHMTVSKGWPIWTLNCNHPEDDPAWLADDQTAEWQGAAGECWTIGWFDECGFDDCVHGDWAEPLHFPLPVRCWYDDTIGLRIEPAVAARRVAAGGTEAES